MSAQLDRTPWADLILNDRVHGSLYRDPAIFARELDRIWYAT